MGIHALFGPISGSRGGLARIAGGAADRHLRGGLSVLIPGQVHILSGKLPAAVPGVVRRNGLCGLGCARGAGRRLSRRLSGCAGRGRCAAVDASPRTASAGRAPGTAGAAAGVYSSCCLSAGASGSGRAGFGILQPRAFAVSLSSRRQSDVGHIIQGSLSVQHPLIGHQRIEALACRQPVHRSGGGAPVIGRAGLYMHKATVVDVVGDHVLHRPAAALDKARVRLRVDSQRRESGKHLCDRFRGLHAHGAVAAVRELHFPQPVQRPVDGRSYLLSSLFLIVGCKRLQRHGRNIRVRRGAGERPAAVRKLSVQKILHQHILSGLRADPAHLRDAVGRVGLERDQRPDRAVQPLALYLVKIRKILQQVVARHILRVLPDSRQHQDCLGVLRHLRVREHAVLLLQVVGQMVIVGGKIAVRKIPSVAGGGKHIPLASDRRPGIDGLHVGVRFLQDRADRFREGVRPGAHRNLAGCVEGAVSLYAHRDGGGSFFYTLYHAAAADRRHIFRRAAPHVGGPLRRLCRHQSGRQLQGLSFQQGRRCLQRQSGKRHHMPGNRIGSRHIRPDRYDTGRGVKLRLQFFNCCLSRAGGCVQHQIQRRIRQVGKAADREGQRLRLIRNRL